METQKRYALYRRIRRYTVVGVGLILANSYYKSIITKSVYDGPIKSGCVPFLNCHACPFAISSCPVGILQHFAVMRKLPFLLMGYLGLIGMVVGRAACGWLCPFGWLQDLIYKIKAPKLSLPRTLLPLKYVSLVVLAILLPMLTGAHWFSRLCPWGTIIAGIPWVLWNPADPTFGDPVISADMIGFHYWLKIGVLVFFLSAFVLYKRPFCRTFCPLGAIYSLFNRISLLQMKVDGGSCRDCDLCRKVCPMDIRVSDDPGSGECIRCLKCTVCKHVEATWRFSNG